MSNQVLRLTASAKRALAEEVVRMADRPLTDVPKLAAMKSDRLLDEFECLQAEYLRVPMWDAFGQHRPMWKIDPQEFWDRDAEATARIAEANKARAQVLL